ncbi:TPA: hypothetical protein LUJ82_000819 [Acinetobacter baumannii]|nr:hypothetical protein [Acinetobacter baumannii]ENU67940.1 hypothetical protein F978_03763 [Acinetobacter baumannii NIPH 615]ENV27795.1 hypothetical protein F961_03798 [Acinetobacter baumannii NIPH 60]EKT8682830.1 hypothetical protein [Acinetobacter baumannii]EKT9125655.1 hypothetical protein [Acinetobacter baumannii]
MAIQLKESASFGWSVGDLVMTTNSQWSPKGKLRIAAVKVGRFATVISAKDEEGKTFTGGDGVFWKVPQGFYDES